MSTDLSSLIEALSDPGIYPHGPKSVDVIQTHISVIFLADDLVYKVKKPLNFGFLDFTSLEKRKFFCRREVELNSRFSEGIYLGVASIHEGPRGINLNREGDEIEVAVLMKRLPEDRLMINMLRDEKVTPESLDRLADRIADIHAQAPTGPEISRYGSIGVIFHNVEENLLQTHPYIGRTMDLETYRAITGLTMTFLERNEALFESRSAHGRIRDCHGDLHLEHVVILNGIVLYDCIEFNERFRYSDTASDLAFLLMDLDFRGYPAFAERVCHRYATSAQDWEMLDIVGFYKSYRAFVRGKVLGFTLDEPEVSGYEKEEAAHTARDYFALSLAYLRPKPRPALIITCGLTGSGKSFLAARLGTRLGIEPVRSDVVRKEILGIDPSEHRLDKYGEGIYTSFATERTYSALFDRAREALSRGESVILDASFGRRANRGRAMDLARESNARFWILECTSPDSVIRSRLKDRMTESGEPSDGRVEIMESQISDFERLDKAESQYRRQCNSSSAVDAFFEPFVREVMITR